jgi:acyl-coenzyme A synthetase/AMP-(fatty) acid ligase
MDRTVPMAGLLNQSTLGGRGEQLRGLSVLIATACQIEAAAALVELDGIAGRLVLCPPDLPAEHIASVLDRAQIDAIVCDRMLPEFGAIAPESVIICSRNPVPAAYDRNTPCETEWVLLTSGTTGVPKLVAHTLSSLSGAIAPVRPSVSGVVWSTFYDIRRYGGLQIFLRAILTGRSLVLSSAQEPTADFLSRAGSNAVTHISGTPSHWRKALMSPAAARIDPEYVRLSGEIADQGILNHLRSFYPKARISHAFATTEAGVAFDVEDGLAGFPLRILSETPEVEMKVEDDSLRIRSTRTASRYLGAGVRPLKDAEGFVDTGDVVEQRDGRYHFAGRRDGIINVGGLKVYPEEVEAVINRHPSVQLSLVRTKKNPITGALVIADIVLKEGVPGVSRSAPEVQSDILSLCREKLASHKVPVAIHFVPSLAIAVTGKLVRTHA